MSRWDRATPSAWAAGLVLVVLAAPVGAQDRFVGIGRAATPAEVRAWDIDVRPDFTGLPRGSGSVAKGQVVWDKQCASCHGTFGESNEVFTPIVGGTTPEDIKTGRVKALTSGDYPQRTTLMKLSSLSSLWDYINRAMPWNAPKSLSTDEVYAVTAYILHLGDVLPADFVLSDGNIRDVQARLPNRNGKTQLHGLWEIRGDADVRNTLCMRDCVAEVKVSSSLPDYAKSAHGNLAAQNRMFGPVRGQATIATGIASAQSGGSAPALMDAQALANKQGCLACHGLAARNIGPAFNEVAAKYRGQSVLGDVAARIRSGGTGRWGAVPMPPQTALSDEEARQLAAWVLARP